MNNFLLISLFWLIGCVSSAHLIESQDRSRPTDFNWTHHYTVTSLLQDFKYDRFRSEIEHSKELLRTASKVEAERIEIEAKHQMRIYETLLKKLVDLEKDDEDIRHLLLEVKSRIILSQSIQNMARRKLNDFLFEDLENRKEMQMDLKAPKLFDESPFPEFRPKPPKPPLFIEPQ